MLKSSNTEGFEPDIETNGNNVESETVTLKSGLNLKELTTKEGTSWEVQQPEEKEPEVENDIFCNNEEVLKYIKSENDGVDSDEEEEEDEVNLSPFEKMARYMIDISPEKDQSVLKQILRPGLGAVVEPRSLVTVHYNAYLEYRSEPYDSTYLRKKKETFRLGDCTTILGLDLSISTMSVKEKANFLIKPEWGYGELGCLPRIPENATLLFEVVLVSAVDNYAAQEFKNLSVEEQDVLMFAQVIKVAKAEQQTGNDLMKANRCEKASECYYRGIRLLQRAIEENENDKNDKNEADALLLKLYQNQCLAFDRLGKFHKVKKWARQALSINPDSAKALYRLGRAHNHFCEWSEARRVLLLARNLEPNSVAVTNELIRLDSRQCNDKKTEELFCKRIFSKSSNVDEKKSNRPNPKFADLVSEEFRNLVLDILTNFKQDETKTEMILPSFNEIEVSCVAATVKVVGGLGMELCPNKSIKLIKKKITTN